MPRLRVGSCSGEGEADNRMHGRAEGRKAELSVVFDFSSAVNSADISLGCKLERGQVSLPMCVIDVCMYCNLAILHGIPRLFLLHHGILVGSPDTTSTAHMPSLSIPTQKLNIRQRNSNSCSGPTRAGSSAIYDVLHLENVLDGT
jgi:hypothetical protein